MADFPPGAPTGTADLSALPLTVGGATMAPEPAKPSKSTPQPRRSRVIGSTHETISGVRRVKGYPVTRDELLTLGGLSLGATIFFSLGTSFVSRSLDIQMNVELSQGVPADIQARWQTKEADYWTFGLVFLFLGVMVVLGGGLKMLSIIRSTDHPS